MSYKFFISYNRSDPSTRFPRRLQSSSLAAVRVVDDLCCHYGLETFLDARTLRGKAPRSLSKACFDALDATGKVIVLIGPSYLGPFQKKELCHLLEKGRQPIICRIGGLTYDTLRKRIEEEDPEFLPFMEGLVYALTPKGDDARIADLIRTSSGWDEDKGELEPLKGGHSTEEAASSFESTGSGEQLVKEIQDLLGKGTRTRLAVVIGNGLPNRRHEAVVDNADVREELLSELDLEGSGVGSLERAATLFRLAKSRTPGLVGEVLNTTFQSAGRRASDLSLQLVDTIKDLIYRQYTEERPSKLIVFATSPNAHLEREFLRRGISFLCLTIRPDKGFRMTFFGTEDLEVGKDGGCQIHPMPAEFYKGHLVVPNRLESLCDVEPSAPIDLDITRYSCLDAYLNDENVGQGDKSLFVEYYGGYRAAGKGEADAVNLAVADMALDAALRDHIDEHGKDVCFPFKTDDFLPFEDYTLIRRRAATLGIPILVNLNGSVLDEAAPAHGHDFIDALDPSKQFNAIESDDPLSLNLQGPVLMLGMGLGDFSFPYNLRQVRRVLKDCHTRSLLVLPQDDEQDPVEARIAEGLIPAKSDIDDPKDGHSMVLYLNKHTKLVRASPRAVLQAVVDQW